MRHGCLEYFLVEVFITQILIFIFIFALQKIPLNVKCQTKLNLMGQVML